jgi:hypothetical protein
MRNANIKLAFMVLQLVLLFAIPISAQDNSKTDDSNRAEFEFLIGEKAAILLRQGCSVLQGTINQVSGSKVNFLLQEKLSGEKYDVESIELNYKKPRPAVGLPSISDSPWRFAEVKEGIELIVFHCRAKSPVSQYSFITSDKSLFQGIKKSVRHYLSYKKNPAVILEIPNLVKDENDSTFIGYLFSFVAEGGAIQHSDNTALVLSQLLASDKIPEVDMGSVRFQLSTLISSDFVFPITQETRAAVLKNLINVGGSNKKLAREAIIILCRISDAGRINLSPYLSPENKNKLLRKLQTLSTDQLSFEARKKFQSLLMN